MNPDSKKETAITRRSTTRDIHPPLARHHAHKASRICHISTDKALQAE